MKPPLYGAAFVALLGVTLLGYGSFAATQTVLPLYAVHLGANSTVVGVLVAAFSLPSFFLRPLIGRWVDEWSRRGVHLLGTACVAAAAFLYLIPGIAAILVVRVVHGTGWAAFNTAGGTAVAALAPAERRGEAAAIYNLMPGIANMAMPALSLMVLAAYGFGTTFIVAGVLGLTAVAFLRIAPFPGEQPSNPERVQAGARGLLESQALLPMSLEFFFAITTTLFWVYPPLFGRALGIPVEQMAAYYLPVGIAVVVSRLLVGRHVDRAARGTVLLFGAAVTAIGLLVAGTAGSIAGLALGGALHALAASMVSPTAMAIAIEGSSEGRTGASIATYSLGYQLGISTGALAWGTTIDAFGFPMPYLLALFCPVALTLIVLRSRRLT